MSDDGGAALARRFASVSEPERVALLARTRWTSTSGDATLHLDDRSFSLEVGEVSGMMMEDSASARGTWAVRGDELVFSLEHGSTYAASGTHGGRHATLERARDWARGRLEPSGALSIGGRVFVADHLRPRPEPRASRRGTWLARALEAPIRIPLAVPPFRVDRSEVVDLGGRVALVVDEPQPKGWAHAVLVADARGRTSRHALPAGRPGTPIADAERGRLAVPVIDEGTVALFVLDEKGGAGVRSLALPSALRASAPWGATARGGVATEDGWALSVHLRDTAQTVHVGARARWARGELLAATRDLLVIASNREVVARDAGSGRVRWKAKHAALPLPFHASGRALYASDRHRGNERLRRIDEATGRGRWAFSAPEIGPIHVAEGWIAAGLPWSEERLRREGIWSHIPSRRFGLAVLDAASGRVAYAHEADLGLPEAIDTWHVALRHHGILSCRPLRAPEVAIWTRDVAGDAACITPSGLFVRRDDALEVHPFADP